MHEDTVLEGNAGALASKNESLPLRERLKPLFPLRFPCFERHYQLGPAHTYAFDEMDCRDWHKEMVSRIIFAVETQSYLPVYRMGDGEYRFALGGHPVDRLPWWRLAPRHAVRRFITRLRGKEGCHKSGSAEYGFEEYSPAEYSQVYSTFVENLCYVATHGILALGLHDRPIYEVYIPAILDWFDANSIIVHRDNYYHVYTVYALMHGPDRFALLKDRRVLVVTGLTPEKQLGIEIGLRQIGVVDVQFLPVSSSKTMLDVLDLRSIQLPVDVALVGAGVGSVNILAQLEPLQTPCLDVGFALSTLANPDLRWNRPFCVPDDEFELDRVRWLK